MDDERNELSSEQHDETTNLCGLSKNNGEMTRSSDNLMECSVRSADMQSERVSNKRNRSLDQDELWMTVGKTGKRFARSIETDDSARVPEEIIEVSITCTEILPKQFKLAKILKEQKIQDVTQVKYINAYKVLVQLSSEESADALISCKLFNENGYRCQKTLQVDQSYGVINGIDLELTDEEILDSLTCEILILGMKRLKRRNSLDGRWIESESIRICFKGDMLPSHVYIFDTRVIVNPYIYPVTQCSRCWRYGHSVRTCSATKHVCPKCGDNHPNCEKTDFICNNCGGKHMALAKICPVFIKEKKIRELMAIYNCTYKQALILYKPREPLSTQYVSPTPIDSSPRAPIRPINISQEEGSGSRDENNLSYAEKTKNNKPNEMMKKSKKKKVRIDTGSNLTENMYDTEFAGAPRD